MNLTFVFFFCFLKLCEQTVTMKSSKFNCLFKFHHLFPRRNKIILVCHFFKCNIINPMCPSLTVPAFNHGNPDPRRIQEASRGLPHSGRVLRQRIPCSYICTWSCICICFLGTNTLVTRLLTY